MAFRTLLPYKRTLYGKHYTISRLIYRSHSIDIQDVVLIKYELVLSSPKLSQALIHFCSYFCTVTFTLGLIPVLEKTAKEPGTDVRIVNVRLLQVILVSRSLFTSQYPAPGHHDRHKACPCRKEVPKPG